MDDWKSYVEQLGKSARRAAGQLATLNGGARDAALRRIASGLRSQTDSILTANAKDIEAAQQADLAPRPHRPAETRRKES